MLLVFKMMTIMIKTIRMNHMANDNNNIYEDNQYIVDAIEVSVAAAASAAVVF